MQNINKNIKI